MCIRDRNKPGNYQQIKMPQPKGKKVKKNVEPELSVEDGEAVQMEEIELEPPTLEMERPIQTADELEEQTGEEPIQIDVYKRQLCSTD